MIILLRWVVRPIVVTVSGAGGAKAAEASPPVGCVAMVISLGLLAWMLADIADIIHRW